MTVHLPTNPVAPVTSTSPCGSISPPMLPCPNGHQPSRGVKQKKAAAGAAFQNRMQSVALRGDRFVLVVILARLHRAAVKTLGIDVAIDELDHRHRRVVAI